MINKLSSQWGIGLAVTAMLVMSPAIEIAKAQENVQLEETEQGFNLYLRTQGEANISTTQDGNVLIADLDNAEIDLEGETEVTHDNPFPGVESLTITQADTDRVQVTVTGTDETPEAILESVANGEVILGLSLPGQEPSQVAAEEPSQQEQPASPSPQQQPPQQEQPASPSPQQQPSEEAQVPSLPESDPPEEPGTDADVMFPDPDVEINQQPAQQGQQPSPELEPTRPRATAPPVGDMAVSTIDSSPDMVSLGVDDRVSRLVLREAPVREVLSLLARSADLNLVFADQAGDEAQQTISVDLENESVQEAFNSVLQLSNLQANRRGNTIFVGANLPRGARNLMTRSVRLNQVPASDAANFLASQGAAGAGDGENSNSGDLLQGLSVSVDERLNSITLVGEPRSIEIATDFLQQLDARRRQVAVNVKIIDVNLLETDDFSTSFSFGIGDSFFVSDAGAAAVGFGGTTPPTSGDVTETRGRPLPPVRSTPIPGDAEAQPFFDLQPDAPFSEPGRSGDVIDEGFIFEDAEGELFESGGTTRFPRSVRPNFGTPENPFQPGITEIDEGEIEFSVPELFQFPSRFLGLLEAEVTSGNAKILTDPTLVVQEGELAQVNLTEEVFGGTELVVREVGDDSFTVEEPVIRDAGLILDIDVQRIDDNGFITLNVDPTVSAISGTQNTPVGEIALLQERSLSSGQIRLRDGQTLILAGIIQDQDRTTVSKVPILGDLPIIGSLFRSTSRTQERQEVIVLLTPQVMDDSLEGGGGSMNYEPGPGAREMLDQQGYPTPQRR
ncbi:type IV pilus secretin family protein [Euhalothece natronophila]|nr:type IV pilus secretin family protein [Euhalothece natronophila]